MRFKKGTLFIVFNLVIPVGAGIVFGFIPKINGFEAIWVGIFIFLLVRMLKESIRMNSAQHKKIPTRVIN